jgi:H+/Cl- antiporter ClcA
MKAMTRVMLWLRLGLAAGIIGVACGLSSAGFLIALEWATQWREAHSWIIWLLPVIGLASGVLYWRWGKGVEAGNNLVIDEVHVPTGTIPVRMAPMVFLASVMTHVGGGSAGREGVALQMGAALADQLVKPLRLGAGGRRLCLMAGISGGFAAIFGAPWAGVIFAMEVLAIGTMRWEGAIVCAIAALIGDRVCILLPVMHAQYDVGILPAFSAMALLWTALAGCLCGVVARAFVLSLHGVSTAAKHTLAWAPWRLVVGGALVAIAVWFLGTTRYIGLGIPMIQEAMATPSLWYDWPIKLTLTAITIGVGFKGGEVTPLFCIGAAFGSALSVVVPLPVGLLAGLGFAAVFAASANAPLACTVMAMELFGLGIGAWAALACTCAWICSGHRGIYGAQRIATAKPLSAAVAPGTRLADLK